MKVQGRVETAACHSLMTPGSANGVSDGENDLEVAAAECLAFTV